MGSPKRGGKEGEKRPSIVVRAARERLLTWEKEKLSLGTKGTDRNRAKKKKTHKPNEKRRAFS